MHTKFSLNYFYYLLLIYYNYLNYYYYYYNFIFLFFYNWKCNVNLHRKKFKNFNLSKVHISGAYFLNNVVIHNFNNWFYFDSKK